MDTFKLNTIEEALVDFQAGKFVIVVDDEDRENEGDLICAAEKITPEMVNFMLKNARGVLCAPVTISRSEELELPHQVQDNTSLLGTPFTVTIDKIGMYHGSLCTRPCCHHPCFGRPDVNSQDLWTSRTHQPALRSGQWCVAPLRTYRSSHRPL